MYVSTNRLTLLGGVLESGVVVVVGGDGRCRVGGRNRDCRVVTLGTLVPSISTAMCGAASCYW